MRATSVATLATTLVSNIPGNRKFGKRSLLEDILTGNNRGLLVDRASVLQLLVNPRTAPFLVRAIANAFFLPCHRQAAWYVLELEIVSVVESVDLTLRI